MPFRLNGRGAAFAGSLLPLPCGVTRHPKTVINRFEMAPPTDAVGILTVGEDIILLNPRGNTFHADLPEPHLPQSPP